MLQTPKSVTTISKKKSNNIQLFQSTRNAGGISVSPLFSRFETAFLFLRPAGLLPLTKSRGVSVRFFLFYETHLSTRKKKA